MVLFLACVRLSQLMRVKQPSLRPRLCPFAELPESEHISVADATWLALNVVSGGGNASNSQPIGVTKIAKSVIAPLADHNISVFMLSTYQTDFILVSGHRHLVSDILFVSSQLTSNCFSMTPTKLVTARFLLKPQIFSCSSFFFFPPAVKC